MNIDGLGCVPSCGEGQLSGFHGKFSENPAILTVTVADGAALKNSDVISHNHLSFALKTRRHISRDVFP